MMRVYRFGLRAPVAGADVARQQFRAAHDYQNELIAIERGRRWAARLVEDTHAVRDAIDRVKGADKKSRSAAVTALCAARRDARVAAADELDRIKWLDKQIRKSARAVTPCYWGSYLDIEARHMAARAAPLYDEDAVTPADPKFRPWRGDLHDPDWPMDGQLGVQVQGGLATAEAYACTDTRVRLRRGGAKDGDRRYGMLSIRVGSDGRGPVWATWPVKISREIPDSARWKWVRVSLRHEGRRPVWSCEITVDDPSPLARSLDHLLEGSIAVEWSWDVVGESVRVASWRDWRGETGEIRLPQRLLLGLRKPDGIRAVRDIIDNDLRPKLQRTISESRKAPDWMRREASTMHLWKSPLCIHRLLVRWEAEAATVEPASLATLVDWSKRDKHLWDYEAGARGEALRERRETYRLLAATWSRRYRHALLSDQDLSREARWGDDANIRFTAGPSELRQAIRNAFGGDEYAIETRWPKAPEDRETWRERVSAAWEAGRARDGTMFAERKEITTNAWKARKAKAMAKRSEAGAARDGVGKCAE